MFSCYINKKQPCRYVHDCLVDKKLFEPAVFRCDPEMTCRCSELFVRYVIEYREGSGFNIYFGCLFRAFEKPEGIVKCASRAEYTVMSPDNKAEVAHLLRGCNAERITSEKHPR